MPVDPFAAAAAPDAATAAAAAAAAATGRPRSRTRAAVRIGLALAVALAALLLLKLVAGVAVPLVAAATLFLLLSPAAEALQRRGAPAGVAATALVFVPALAFGTAAVLSADHAVAWARGVAAALGRVARDLAPLDAAGGSVAALAQRLVASFAWTEADVAAWAGREALPAALATATVLMLVFFLLLGQRPLYAALLRALPGRRVRVRWAAGLREARDGVASYLAAIALINAGLALATGAALAWLGLPGVAAWAVAIFALLFVPYLGPLAVALLLAAAGHEHGTAPFAAPLLFLGLHAVEANFFSPWFTGLRLSMSRPALLVAVIAGGWAWGVAGGVLAVPIAIAVRAALRRLPGHQVGVALLEGEAAGAPALAATTAAALVPEAAPPAGPVGSVHSAAAEPPPSARVHRMPPRRQE